MPTTKALPKAKNATGGVSAALVTLQPGAVNEAAIKTIIGKRVCKSLAEVAAEFGISEGTVRVSWRGNGMPGDPGKYPLAEIVVWRLQRNADNAKHMKSSSTTTGRMKEIELETAELALAERQHKASLRSGEYVLIAQVKAEFRQLLSIFSRSLLTIPRSLTPMLPAGVADTATAELEKLIRGQLVKLASSKVAAVKLTSKGEGDETPN